MMRQRVDGAAVCPSLAPGVIAENDMDLPNNWIET